jgi:hypothetical protein
MDCRLVTGDVSQTLSDIVTLDGTWVRYPAQNGPFDLSWHGC